MYVLSEKNYGFYWLKHSHILHICLIGLRVKFFVKQLCNGEYALVAFQQDAQLGSKVSACYGMEAGFWLFFILDTNHQVFLLSHYG